MPRVHTRSAIAADVPLILTFIRALAEYEHLSAQCVASEADLHTHLFGPRPAAEVLIGEIDGLVVGFALFFTSFSTFLGKPGLYLEDVYVSESHRAHGVGRALLSHVAQLGVERNYGRLEWAVLDWNAPSIEFYKRCGAVPMDEWTTYRVTGDALKQLADGATA